MQTNDRTIVLTYVGAYGAWAGNAMRKPPQPQAGAQDTTTRRRIKGAIGRWVARGPDKASTAGTTTPTYCGGRDSELGRAPN